MNRNDVIGKVLAINGTCYYGNEIVAITFSRCGGMTDDASDFKFEYEKPHERLSGEWHFGQICLGNLGCIYTRRRKDVMLCKNDIIALAERNLSKEKLSCGSPYTQVTKSKEGFWFVTFMPHCIKLQRCHFVTDKYTGKQSYTHYADNSTYNFPHLGWFNDSRWCSCHYVTDSFGDAIDKIADYCKELFVDENQCAEKEYRFTMDEINHITMTITADSKEKALALLNERIASEHRRIENIAFAE